AGIDFKHFSGMTAEKYFPTANGSGVAFLDYDNDGKLDIYFATGTYFPVGSRKTGSNKLYKNLGGGKFKDVTKESGLGFEGYCHGIIAGDIDNDGDADVFLCNCGPNALYLNNGNGTFTDISKSAGIDRDGWSSGGALLDYDNDGDLDIYVANYGKWKLPEDDHYCGDQNRGIRTYCAPHTIKTVKHFFYRNNGDGTFTDVYDRVIIDPATKAPRGRDDGRGFGVVAADLDGDGRIDLFVANDMSPNFLFINRGDGTFDDATEACGAAFDAKGHTQSAMGADAEDIDGDGRPELFITNFDGQYNTLYRNLGDGRFHDVAFDSGMARDTLPWVGWGAALVDLDGDGWPDNFVSNGHVDDNLRLLGQTLDHEEPALLFYNVEGKKFRLATRDAGPYFAERHVGRGAAFGDIDDDGDIDIVANHKDGPAALLRNDTPRNGNAWIRLDLRGTRSNRDAIGARVEVAAGGRTIHRQRKGGCSLESTNDPRLLIGLGRVEEVESLVVRWPSGAVTKREHLKPGRAYPIVEPAK
ncbi:MAG TPA: CRTAC1 family protein, partial [Isosphaeraceae bacterium]|nr:CRTAC1 family protein [Isosphaeraceae bacterium]